MSIDTNFIIFIYSHVIILLIFVSRKSEEGSSKKSDKEKKSADSDLPAEYLNSPLSRESQVGICQKHCI